MNGYTFAIRTDAERNLMHITQRGRPTEGDLIDLKGAYLVELEKLRPGFSIVNDQSEMEAYEREAMAVARDLVSITNQHGAARVIRVLPPDLLTTVVISTTLLEGRCQYATIRVASLEEAEVALEEFCGRVE